MGHLRKNVYLTFGGAKGSGSDRECKYRIYFFGPWEWALIRGWSLVKFSPFLVGVVCLFCNKIINGNNKTGRWNKARFLENTLKKTPSSGKPLISTYSDSISSSLSLKSTTDLKFLGAASSMSDIVTWANGLVAREADKACWMDVRRSRPV